MEMVQALLRIQEVLALEEDVMEQLMHLEMEALVQMLMVVVLLEVEEEQGIQGD